MRSRLTRSTMRGLLLGAVASALVAGLVPRAAAAVARPASDATRLEGTWHVQVTTVDCATGTPILTFPAMLSFSRGGILTGTTSNPAFQAGQRSPDHGIWSRLQDGGYGAVSEAFILFTSQPNPPLPGFQKGKQRITQAIEMSGADSFTSDAATEFFDENGNVVASGCATALATRFE